MDHLSLIQLLGGVSIVVAFMFLLYLLLLLSTTLHYHDRGYDLVEAFKKAKKEIK
jgi:hypothetical protein